MIYYKSGKRVIVKKQYLLLAFMLCISSCGDDESPIEELKPGTTPPEPAEKLTVIEVTGTLAGITINTRMGYEDLEATINFQ